MNGREPLLQARKAAPGGHAAVPVAVPAGGSDARAACVLICASLVVNVVVLAVRGVQLGVDSQRYITGAEALLRGPLQGKASSYIGYVLFVALSKAAGLGLAGAVLGQIVLAALASGALYDLARRLGGDRAGVIAAGFVIVNPDVVRWHHYVLTDSPYTSLVVLCGWAFRRGADLGGSWYFWASCVALVAALVRPNGWILLPLACTYWIHRAVRRSRPRRLWVVAVFILSGLALIRIPFFREVIGRESLDVMLLRGEVIWGHAEGRLEMPRAELAERGWSPAAHYVLRHPLASARLAGARVLAELSHVRPFYSARHNVGTAVVVGSLYLLAGVGLAAVWRESTAKLLLGMIAAHLALVGVTFADWDGRFLLHVLPLIGIFSACGVARLTARLAPPSHPPRITPDPRT